MDTERWKKVEALFNDAVERPAEDRESYLRSECGGDEALFNEVMQLIEADESPHSLLNGRAIDAIDDVLPGQPATLPPGTRVGPYEIVDTIGVGGMGVVYTADRADGQFEQRVALKLIKRGMDSEQILSRFRAERRILARLRHPNIANLLDGGVTENGLPFFTMEFVDGQPITDYCDDRSLAIEDRLSLFMSVCAAVQYAHNNLVVHRDLKPSNILVTREGKVKLLDFGIARVLGDDNEGLTLSGQRVMTPAYASPEQVRGAPVTTATDVYSLGVVLYQLLCGRHPHRDTVSATAELERAIAETPVDRPSRFLSRVDTAATRETQTSPDSIGRARNTTPARLTRRLEGDLDTICLVALHKEPDRRYSSPGHLRDDIERHLAGRPVTARPDTLRYRVGKFLRRNRVGVAAAAAIAVVVAALTTAYTIRLAQERDRARLEARKAAEVKTFLGSLFSAADPYTSRGETITAREMLDRGRDRVHEELEDQPDVLADMLFTIGTAYGNLGAFDDAVKLLEESVAIRVELGEEESPAVVETSTKLGEYLNETGRYDESERVGRRAVEIGRTLDDRRPLAAALSVLATSLNYQGRFDGAEEYFREGIELYRRLEGPESVVSSPMLNNLALLLHEQSRYAEADSLFRIALAIQERAYGRRHPETATTRYNFAQLLADEGHLSEARAMWDEVLATDRELYPQGHPYIAFTLSAYGRLLSRMGEFERAEQLQREALEIRRRFHGEENADVAYSLGSLGRVLYDQAQYDEAEALLRRALELHKRINGPEHPVIGNLKNAIGHIQFARGQYASADTSYAKSLDFQRRVSGGDERNQMVVSLVRRADVLAVWGRFEEAEAMAREGVAMAVRLHGNAGMGPAVAKVSLASVLARAGRTEEAEPLFEEGLALMRALERGAPPRPRDCAALIGLGRCRLAAGDIAAAGERFSEALEIGRRYHKGGHPDIARAETAMARAMIAAGDGRAAEPMLRSALATLSPLVTSEQVDRIEAEDLLFSLTSPPERKDETAGRNP